MSNLLNQGSTMYLSRKLTQSASQGTEGVTRSLDFTLAKLTEELGELAVEVQIAQGRLPEDKGGSDGVVGECVDVINVALDLAFLYMNQEGQKADPYKVEQILLHLSGQKIQRWQDAQKQIEEMQ